MLWKKSCKLWPQAGNGHYMCENHNVSIRQSCKAVGTPRSTYGYKKKPKDDQPIIDGLLGLTGKHPAIGFWQCYHRLRAMGRPWNHKRVYRVYTALRLNIRRRAKKRLPARAKQQLFQPEEPNQVWRLDFMHDSLWDGCTRWIGNNAGDIMNFYSIKERQGIYPVLNRKTIKIFRLNRLLQAKSNHK